LGRLEACRASQWAAALPTTAPTAFNCKIAGEFRQRQSRDRDATETPPSRSP
jgi:hypothetical protein